MNIADLYNALGLTKTDFARKLGVSHVAITNIEKRKSISRHMIATICAVFPRVSRAYLETGLGEMFVGNPDNGVGTAFEDRAHYDPSPEDPPDLPELVEKFVYVMRSEDTVTKEALKQNVIAFHVSVRRAEGAPADPRGSDFKIKKRKGRYKGKLYQWWGEKGAASFKAYRE